MQIGNTPFAIRKVKLLYNQLLRNYVMCLKQHMLIIGLYVSKLSYILLTMRVVEYVLELEGNRVVLDHNEQLILYI
mgnify:FL=1